MLEEGSIWVTGIGREPRYGVDAQNVAKSDALLL